MANINNQAAIRDLIGVWTNAICDGDMDQLVASRTGDIVMFDVPEPLQLKGVVAYRQSWELFFAHNPAGPDRFRISELSIEASDTLGFAHGLLTINGGDARCRLTIGLVKIEGKWKVSHEHHSMPLKIVN